MATFKVVCKDSNNRRVVEGGASVLASITAKSLGAKEAGEEVAVLVKDNGDGSYSGMYTVSARGNYEVRPQLPLTVAWYLVSILHTLSDTCLQITECDTNDVNSFVCRNCSWSSQLTARRRAGRPTRCFSALRKQRRIWRGGPWPLWIRLRRRWETSAVLQPATALLPQPRRWLACCSRTWPGSALPLMRLPLPWLLRPTPW